MPVKDCVLKIRKLCPLVKQRKKLKAIGLNSDFFPPDLDCTPFVYISLI